MSSPLDHGDFNPDDPVYREAEQAMINACLMQLSVNVQMTGYHPLSAAGKAIAMRVITKSMAHLVATHKGRFVSAN